MLTFELFHGGHQHQVFDRSPCFPDELEILSNPIDLKLTPNEELSIRAKTSVAGRNKFPTQLDVLVSRSAVRPGAIN